MPSLITLRKNSYWFESLSREEISFVVCKSIFIFVLSVHNIISLSRYEWVTSNEATFREVLLPSPGNVNDYVAHICGPRRNVTLNMKSVQNRVTDIISCYKKLINSWKKTYWPIFIVGIQLCHATEQLRGDSYVLPLSPQEIPVLI